MVCRTTDLNFRQVHIAITIRIGPDISSSATASESSSKLTGDTHIGLERSVSVRFPDVNGLELTVSVQHLKSGAHLRHGTFYST